ncbi:MAG: TolC family protein [Desulfobacteraceae bacterium]|nr:TolC family protein [Desulfobacteraceae bacterium]
MLPKDGQVVCPDLMAIDFASIGMGIQRRVRGGIKVLCLSIVLAMAFLGCKKAMPELDPNKFASTAPGKAYVVSKEKKPDSLPAKKLPGLSDERQPSGHEFTLAQLVDVALRINPSTKVAWERARSAAAQWGVARGDYYPTISGDASGTGIGGSARGVYGQVGLSLSYLLLDFGGREASVESARQVLAAANWNHNQAIQDVLRNVPQAYYEYIGYKAQVRASEASLKEALTSLTSTEQRRKAGVSTIADVLQARSNADQVRLTLVTNRGGVKVSRGDLATAVGWPANIDFDVAVEPADLPLSRMEQNTKELINLALRDRPDLASARATVRQGKADLDKAESDLWPKLIATGNAGWTGINARMSGSGGGFEGMDIDSSDISYYGGLALQIPIFEGFSLRNKVRVARSDLAAARAALRVKEEEVISDVWRSYYNVRTAAQQVETSKTLLASSTESYRVSLARYRAGAADIVELLNAQSLLVSARSQEVQARTDLFTYYAELVHAIGADLPSAPTGNLPGSELKGEESPHGKK